MKPHNFERETKDVDFGIELKIICDNCGSRTSGFVGKEVFDFDSAVSDMWVDLETQIRRFANEDCDISFVELILDA